MFVVIVVVKLLNKICRVVIFVFESRPVRRIGVDRRLVGQSVKFSQTLLTYNEILATDLLCCDSVLVDDAIPVQ
jgi:hypothetical protein